MKDRNTSLRQIDREHFGLTDNQKPKIEELLLTPAYNLPIQTQGPPTPIQLCRYTRINDRTCPDAPLRMNYYAAKVKIQ